ncbi:hypothetical protein OLVG_00205 [Ostreococcus lucimarinus virus OlV6]|nr:hypothetical protein OLVG_00205 [Ostreococcus lucimarinus virus OlV6]
MSCKYALCDHWTWDGDGSCWWGLTGNYKNTCSNSSADGTPVLGGHGCRVSSYRISGCEDHEILGYYQTNYRGNPAVFRGPRGDLRDNALRSVKVTAIPKRLLKRISIDTDGECPGATNTYKRAVGKKNACFMTMKMIQPCDLYWLVVIKPTTRLPKKNFANYPKMYSKTPEVVRALNMTPLSHSPRSTVVLVIG